MGFTAFVSLDPSTKLGVGLLWRGMGDPDIDVVVTGRLLVARFPVLNIVNIYAPSGKFRANERREFFGCDLVCLVLGLLCLVLLPIGAALLTLVLCLIWLASVGCRCSYVDGWTQS